MWAGWPSTSTAGRTEAEGAEMRAGQLDFAEGQRGGGDDVVDARIGGGRFGGGLGGGAGHVQHDLRIQNA